MLGLWEKQQMVILKQKYLYVLVVGLLHVLTPCISCLMANEKPALNIVNPVNQTRFSLEYNNGIFAIRSKNSVSVNIPSKWLIPEPSEPIVPSDFSKTVHSFSLGAGVTGLHLSSWRDDSRNWGSSMQAFGSDIFLIYHEKSHQITPGLLGMGHTKSRWGAMGCRFAQHHNFYLNDVNHDGFTDIGIIKERIFCVGYTDTTKDVDLMTGPKYQKSIVKWFIFTNGKWIESKQTDTYPINIENSIELPLIGLVKSPIDYVSEKYGKKLKPIIFVQPTD